MGQPARTITAAASGARTDYGTADAIARSQALRNDYLAAVAALVTDDDIQHEQRWNKRTERMEDASFKKKSAWKKLAAHFGISLRVVSKDVAVVSRSWVATVVMEAKAPWGQTVEAVGACGSDESKGRRVVTFADGMATAETRASNRAIANIIAAGEVSAEEAEKTAPVKATEAVTDMGPAGTMVPPNKPLGHLAGFRLGELDDAALAALADALAPDKPEKQPRRVAFIAAVHAVQAKRTAAASAGVASTAQVAATNAPPEDAPASAPAPVAAPEPAPEPEPAPAPIAPAEGNASLYVDGGPLSPTSAKAWAMPMPEVSRFRQYLGRALGTMATTTVRDIMRYAEKNIERPGDDWRRLTNACAAILEDRERIASGAAQRSAAARGTGHGVD